MVKIALSQQKISSNVEHNIQASLLQMATASDHGAQLIAFPEIQFSPFFPQFPNRDASQYLMAIDGNAMTQIKTACRDNHIVACPNIYLSEGGSAYDATPVIDANGELLGVSKMVHIMQGEKFYEQDYYTPSDTGFQVYDTAIGRIGIVICFDRHRPESIKRCSEQGAELIIIPTANCLDEPMELFEWEVRVAAYQNSVFIAMCNRVGLEHDMNFAGQSMVAGPQGELIAKAGGKEQILYADIDLSLVEVCRKKQPTVQCNPDNQ